MWIFTEQMFTSESVRSVNDESLVNVDSGTFDEIKFIIPKRLKIGHMQHSIKVPDSLH